MLASQSGVVPEQSEDCVHCTQTFLAVSQAGVLPEQLEFSVHSTQTFLAVSQTVFAPEHSEFCVHSTHLLDETMQAGVGLWHAGAQVGAPPVLTAPPVFVEPPLLVEPPASLLAPPEEHVRFIVQSEPRLEQPRMSANDNKMLAD